MAYEAELARATPAIQSSGFRIVKMSDGRYVPASASLVYVVRVESLKALGPAERMKVLDPVVLEPDPAVQ